MEDLGGAGNASSTASTSKRSTGKLPAENAVNNSDAAGDAGANRELQLVVVDSIPSISRGWGARPVIPS